MIFAIVALVVVSVVLLGANEVAIQAMVGATEAVSRVQVTPFKGFTEEEVVEIGVQQLEKAFGKARTYHQYSVEVEV